MSLFLLPLTYMLIAGLSRAIRHLDIQIPHSRYTEAINVTRSGGEQCSNDSLRMVAAAPLK